MINISTSFQINVCIEEDEFSVSNLCESVYKMNIRQSVVTQIIQQIDEESVTEYCGERYTTGNVQKFSKG
jgi:hypothetical protein